MPAAAEEIAEGCRRIGVVIDDEYAQASVAHRLSRGRLCRDNLHGRNHKRKAHGKGASLSRSRARGVDRTAMHHHDRSDERETNSQAAAHLRRLRSHLAEHLKYPLERVWGNADPIVGDTYHGMIAVAVDGDADVAPRVSVFDAVVDQVCKDLMKPIAVTVYHEAPRLHVHPERVVALLDQRPTGLDCAGEHISERHLLTVQMQLAVRNASHIQKVIDQAG